MIRDITIGQYYPAKSVNPQTRSEGEDCMHPSISDIPFSPEQHPGLCDRNLILGRGYLREQGTV